MSARYLVQVRNYGEEWRTVDRCAGLTMASALADARAAERVAYEGYAYPLDLVKHVFVRVAFHGRTVYDPRAPKVPQVATC